ncbi:MAG: hypothetical protein L6R35_006013 [Caloplaca aegaea]|nr:MAG: hypothetical protein L6R35_006013 [Caloplaca aegaea]
MTLQEGETIMTRGELECSSCATLVNASGAPACECPSPAFRLRNPTPPISALDFFHEDSSGRRWSASRRVFDVLPVEDQEHWEAKAAMDRERFEQQKRAYNATLQLEEDILTDQEAIDDCDCRNVENKIRAATQRQRCEQQWVRYRQDHRKFNERYKAPEQAVGPGQFHRFRHLPIEIQDQIYTHIFKSSQETSELRQWQLEFEAKRCESELRFSHTRPLDTRLLAVSREVYSAAVIKLYSTNRFVVDVSKASVLPLFIRDSTGVSPPRPTSRIKRWHVRLMYRDKTDTSVIQRQLVAVRNAMKQCTSLDEVRFTWIIIPNYWSELPPLMKLCEAMLNVFQNIRGVKKVIFAEPTKSIEKNQLLDEWGSINLVSEEARHAVKHSMESRP